MIITNYLKYLKHLYISNYIYIIVLNYGFKLQVRNVISQNTF